MNFPLNVFEGAPKKICCFASNHLYFETLGTLETKIIFKWLCIYRLCKFNFGQKISLDKM